MPKENVDNNPRGSYAATGGEERLDGRTDEKAKLIVQSAIQVAADLDPPPQSGNSAFVTVSQGGNFADGIVLPGFVNLDASGAAFNTNQPVAVTMGTGQIVRTDGVDNSMDGSTCWLIDGESLAGINTLFTGVFGAGGIGCEIKGTCSGIFYMSDQIRIEGDGATAIKITGTCSDPIDIDADVALLNGNNAVFMDYNPDNATDAAAVDISTVFSAGATPLSRGIATGTGYIARGGRLTVNGIVLISGLAANVKDGAVMDLQQNVVVGDIDVEEGGTLNVDILSHPDGAIIEDGTINGLIGGKPFGNHRQKHQEQTVLRASDSTVQSPTVRDDPLQVKFGPAQFGPTDPVQLDADGSMTFNEADQYNLRLLLEYGRTNAGSTSILIFRLLVDGTQFGDSQYAKIDSAQAVQPIEFSGPVNFAAGEVLTVEIIRDLGGFNDGALFPFIPSLAGVNPAPSATMLITRNRLVQPV